MRIKKGDNVVVIAGKDRGKQGKILRFDVASERLLIEGINLYKKHRKPRRQGEKGEMVTLPRTINASNAQFFCSSCGRGVRLGARIEGEKKVRYCKHCNRTV